MANLQEVGEDAKKKEGSMAGPSPLWLGDELEFWPEKTMGTPMRYETTLSDSVPSCGSGIQDLVPF